MDPETSRAVVQLLTGIAGGLIGWFAARENQRGQRAIARDNARRADLKELLAPLRTRVTERTAQLVHARDAARFLLTMADEADSDVVDEAQAAVAAIRDRSQLYRGDWAASGHSDVAALYERWKSAEARCYWNVRGLDDLRAGDDPYGVEDDPLWTALAEATVDLTAAINAAIHGTALVDEPSPRRGIRQRLAGLVRLRR